MGLALKQMAVSALRARGLLLGLALLFILGGWLWLGLHTFAVGPSEWDDHYYCQLAISPSKSWEAINRYVHVWGLHLSYLVFGARGLSLFPILGTLGACGGAYVVGRLALGRCCGLIAMACLPLFPALLRYLDAPFSDVSMGAFGVLACAAAGIASISPAAGSRRRWWWTAASGLACFLAAKSKETGIAVIPAVLLLLSASPGATLAAPNDASEARPASAPSPSLPKPVLWRGFSKWLLIWGAGALLGWLLLACGDALFLHDFTHSFDLRSYVRRLPNFNPEKAAAPNAAAKFGSDFLSVLTSKAFLGWTLVGAAGGLLGLKRSVMARALAVWAFASLVLAALVASRYAGIHALPRYLVVPGIPLVVLGAYYVVCAWRTPIASPQANWWLRALLLGLAALTLLVFGSATTFALRSSYFLLPWLLIFLLLLPLHTRDRFSGRAALIFFAGLLLQISIADGLAEQRLRRLRMAPWDKLARHLVAQGASSAEPTKLALYRLGKPYGSLRIQRRLWAREPALWDRVAVDTLQDVQDLTAAQRIVITRRGEETALLPLGFKRFVTANAFVADESAGDFAVFIRPSE